MSIQLNAGLRWLALTALILSTRPYPATRQQWTGRDLGIYRADPDHRQHAKWQWSQVRWCNRTGGLGDRHRSTRSHHRPVLVDTDGATKGHNCFV